MNIIVNFFTKYAFILVWAFILLFNIWETQSGKLYRYEQRIPNKVPNRTTAKNNSFIFANQKFNIKRIKIILIVVYFIIIICSISFLLAYGFNHNQLTYALISLTLILLATAFTEALAVIKSLCKFKLYLRSVYIILFMALYCLWAYDKNFFVDLLLIFITLIIYSAFAKSKYNYPVLITLFGINVIILSNSFDNNQISIIHDILFSLGTGLIATGIGNAFFVIEKEKMKINERKLELDDIKFILEESMENIFSTYNPLLCHQYEDFRFINYEQFKKDLIQYLDTADSNNLAHELQEEIIYNIELMEEYTKNFLKNEKYFILNKIFNQDEINIIHDLYEISHNMLIQYKAKNNIGLKKLFQCLIRKYDELTTTIPEIEDLINQFGKDKIYVEYEVGTLRQVWPNGEKVKPDEIYKPKSKHRH